MKTAISVDDSLMKAADGAARKLRISRSRLISIALERFLQERRSQEILERLDRVYGEDSDPEESGIVQSFKSKLRSAAKDRW